MSETTFKEKIANFFSYVKLFAFIIGVGALGYYFYQRHQSEKAELIFTSESPEPGSTESDAAILVEKPSLLLKRVLAENLPLLWSDFNETPITLTPTFTTAKALAKSKKAELNSLQPTWKLADQICQEIESVYQERSKLAPSALTPVEVASKPGKQKGAAVAEAQAAASRQEFFRQSAMKKWKAQGPVRRKKIEAMYQQLVAAEAAS